MPLTVIINRRPATFRLAASLPLRSNAIGSPNVTNINAIKEKASTINDKRKEEIYGGGKSGLHY